MGYGDELIASGQARGAKARGKRVAFGDGVFIHHHKYATLIHRGNPNVAFPGEEGSSDLEWVKNYRGHRPYNRNGGDHWEFIEGFGNRPGEVFLDDEEKKFGVKNGRGCVLIEPSVPAFKRMAANKRWPRDRYEAIAERLMRRSVEVIQFDYDAPYGPVVPIRGARTVRAPTFRHAVAVVAASALYLGPEGGLHHAAAATGTPAVVLFGGFISPAITGYSSHVNFYAGGKPCGSFDACSHCRTAMESITLGAVDMAVEDQLQKRAA